METLCSNNLFRFFLRKNFPDVKISNDEADAINVDFSEYLRNECTEKQLDNFVPKNEIEVIIKMDHPLEMNGFHPAFVYHFTIWVDKQKEEIENNE